MRSLPGTASIGSGLKGMQGTRTTNGVINLQGPRYRKSADTIRLINSPPSVKLSWPVETHSEIKGACSKKGLGRDLKFGWQGNLGARELSFNQAVTHWVRIREVGQPDWSRWHMPFH
jgi:hypothetical protein